MGKSWKNPLKEEMAQKKGKLFSKLAKEITVAARIGGPNPQNNSRLRLALSNARAASCPRETIDRCIKKALDQKAGKKEDIIFELSYEAIGPYQSQWIIECQSENKNRTLSYLKTILKKYKAHLTEVGSLSWNFEKICRIQALHEDIKNKDIEIEAIEVDADQVKANKNGSCHFFVHEEKKDKVSSNLLDRKWLVSEIKILYQPKNPISLDKEKKKLISELLKALDENEDVFQVHVNVDLDSL